MLTKLKTKPRSSASFPVRRMDYQFNDLPKYWCDHDPALTHFFTGLSTLFPEGEAFFVRSVRAVRHLAKDDAALDRDIGAFIGQEAMHSKEHHAFHLSAQQHGLDLEALEKATGVVMKTIERIFPQKWNLLVTVGVEHYTAVLVEEMMRTTNTLMTDTTIRNLWLWHSIEETEHKALAFDLYEYLYGKGLDAYIPRVALFTFGFTVIMALSYVYQVRLMAQDKQLSNIKSWAKYARFMGTNLKKLTPKMLEYYRFDFHPNDTQIDELVTKTKAKIGIQPASPLVS